MFKLLFKLENNKSACNRTHSKTVCNPSLRFYIILNTFGYFVTLKFKESQTLFFARNV